MLDRTIKQEQQISKINLTYTFNLQYNILQIDITLFLIIYKLLFKPSLLLLMMK